MDVRVEVRPGLCQPNAPAGLGQDGFLRDWSNMYCALEGGWGSGKTWAGARKLLLGHVYNAVDADGGLTFTQSAVMGPTYRSMMDYDRPALAEAFDDFGIEAVWRGGDKAYELPEFSTRRRRSRILFRSAERPELIAGWEVGMAWGDEPTRWPEDWANPKGDSFMQLLGRVRGRARMKRIMLTYTNEGDGTRMYDEFNTGKPGHSLYRASTLDNTSVAEFAARLLERLTKDMAQQYVHGGTMNLRGANCYGSYSAAPFPAGNLAGRVEPIAGLPLVLTLDFNINPGMHGILGQYVPLLDRFKVFGVIFRPRLNVRDLVPEVARFCVERFGGVNAFPWLDIYGDASGHSESPNTSESAYDTLITAMQECGFRNWRMNVPRDHPPVVDRLCSVNMALADVRGERHVEIDGPASAPLAEDLARVKFDDKGKVDKKNPMLTHAADAFGYWVHYVRPVRVPRLDGADDAGSRFNVTVAGHGGGRRIGVTRSD